MEQKRKGSGKKGEEKEEEGAAAGRVVDHIVDRFQGCVHAYTTHDCVAAKANSLPLVTNDGSSSHEPPPPPCMQRPAVRRDQGGAAINGALLLLRQAARPAARRAGGADEKQHWSCDLIHNRPMFDQVVKGRSTPAPDPPFPLPPLCTTGGHEHEARGPRGRAAGKHPRDLGVQLHPHGLHPLALPRRRGGSNDDALVDGRGGWVLIGLS